MKFRVSFLTDTGIDPVCSCTISGACMHVSATSYLKEKTIAKLLKQVDRMDHVLLRDHRCPIQACVVWG